MKKRFFSLIALTLVFIFILSGCSANIKIIESDSFKEAAEAANFVVKDHTEYSDSETLIAGYYAETDGGHLEYFLFEDVKTTKMVYKNYFDVVDNLYNQGGAKSALTINFKNYERLQITKGTPAKYYDAIRVKNMVIFVYADTSEGISNVKKLLEDLDL